MSSHRREVSGKRDRDRYYSDSRSPSRKRSRYHDDRERNDRYSEYSRSEREERDQKDRKKNSSRDRNDRDSREEEIHKERKNRHKKEKKEKKERKKEKKRKLRELKQKAELFLQQKEEPRGYPPPTILCVSENYYSHNREFRYWLKNSNKPLWDDLNNSEAREYFSTFCTVYNEGELADRYYSGDPETYKPSPRSLDSPNTITRKEIVQDDVPKRLDQYEREKQRETTRIERKKYRKHNDYVNEELVPKETGREAQLEKKKQKAAYSKMEKQTEKTFSDSFLMGSGGNEYQSMLQRSKQRKAEREEKDKEKQMQRQDLQAKYRAKEEELMASFRSVVQSGNIPLMQYKHQ